MTAINNGGSGTRLQQQLRSGLQKNNRGAMLGNGLWSVFKSVGDYTGLSSKIADISNEAKILASQIVSVAPSISSSVAEVAAESFGEIVAKTANFNYRNIDADIQALKDYFKTTCDLSEQEVELLISEIDVNTAELLEAIPVRLRDQLNQPEQLPRFYALAMIKNIVINYTNSDLYTKSFDPTKNQDLIGKAVVHALNTVIGKLPQAENQSSKYAATSLGFGGIDRQAIIDEVIKVFMPAEGVRLLMRGESFITKKLANFYIPSIVDKYVKGYLVVNNDVSEVSTVTFDIVDELINHFETHRLPEIKESVVPLLKDSLPGSPLEDKQKVPVTPGQHKRVLFEKLLQQTLGNIDPVKTPELYNYARDKVKPILALTIQVLYNEGQRIQEGADDAMNHLDDHALVLLGGFSVSKIVAQEFLKEGSTTESVLNALKIKFPAFARIHLPAELQQLFLEVLHEQGAKHVIPAVRDLEKVTSRNAQNSQTLIEMYGRKPVAADADPDEPVVSTLDAPIRAMKNLTLRAIKELVAEEGDGSLSQLLAQEMQNNGFKLSEAQSQNILHVVAHSDNPEIAEVWNLLDQPIDSLYKEIFARLARVSFQNPNLLIDLIEKIIGRIGTARVDGQTQLRVPDYQAFSLELLAMLGFNGPDDLDFIHSPELRKVVWDLIGNKMIGEILQTTMTRIFNPDGIRGIFISIINTLNESPEAPPSARVQQPHVELDAATSEAFGRIGAILAEKLKIPHMRGKVNNPRFVQWMGHTLANITFDSLQNMYGDPATGKPSILKLIAHSLDALTPVLESNEVPPEVEVEQAETFRVKSTVKRMTAENDVDNAALEIEIALEEEESALEALNALKGVGSGGAGFISPDLIFRQEQAQKRYDVAVANVEVAHEAFKKAIELRDHATEVEKSAIIQADRTKACLKDIYDARRKEFVQLAKKLPRTQTKLFIKGLWIGFKKAFKDRAVIIFGAEAVVRNKVFFKQVRKYLFLNLVGKLFKGLAVIPKEAFWMPIELIVGSYAKRSSRLLDEYSDFIADMPFDILGGASEVIGG